MSKTKKELIPASDREIRFLEGPKSRRFEMGFVLRVAWEFITGFRKLHFAGPCVSVFGSARLKEDDPYYAKARELGSVLAREGFTVLTGGGPGIMEAANRGAQDVGGRSFGCTIELAFETEANPYLDDYVHFEYFFVRKVMLVKYSYGFVIMPGGVGTLDEFFETLTLIQTQKITDFPVVLIGTEFFEPLVNYLETTMAGRTISFDDLDLFLLTDDLEEAVEFIKENSIEKYGLKYTKPSRLLGET